MATHLNKKGMMFGIGMLFLVALLSIPIASADQVVYGNLYVQNNVTVGNTSTPGWFNGKLSWSYLQNIPAIAYLANLTNYLTLSRATTDFYNKTETLAQINSHKFGNTTTEIWAVVNNGTFLTYYRNLTDSDIRNLGYLKTGNTSSEIWTVINNGTFLTSYRNLSSNDVWNIVNNGTFLTSYRNLTDNDITVLGYIKSYRNLTDSDISNLGYIKSYRNLTDSDITNLGYIKTYRNLTEQDILNMGFIKTSTSRGNTSEEMIAATRNTYLNKTGDVISGNLTPSVTNTFSLGTILNAFKSVYATTFYQGGVALDSIYCRLTGCYMTGNLITTQNISAQYYYGDGSKLIGVATSGGRGNSSEEIWYVVNNGTFLTGENSPYLTKLGTILGFDESVLNATIDARAGASAGNITSVTVSGYYLTGGGSSGAVVIGFDEAKLNATIGALDRNLTSADISNMGYVLLSRINTDIYNKSVIELMNTSLRGLPRGNTSSEIWSVVNNGTFLTYYRNLTDSDITNLGYIKSAALSPYLTLARAATDYYNKTQMDARRYGNTSQEIWVVVNNGTFLTYYRNLTDSDITNLGYIKTYRNLTDNDIANMGYIKTSGASFDQALNTTSSVKFAYLDITNPAGEAHLDFNTTVDNVARINWNANDTIYNWISLHNGHIELYVHSDSLDETFSVYSSGLAEWSGNRLTVGGVDVLTAYRNLTSNDISNMGFATLTRVDLDYYNKSIADGKYLTLARVTTDYYNKSQMDGRRYGNTTTEIWAVINNGTFITEYRNLTQTDIQNLGFVQLSRLNSDYYNKTQLDARRYGNTTTEIWAVVNNGTYATVLSLNSYLTLARATTDYYNKTETNSQINAHTFGNTSAEILAVTNGVYYKVIDKIQWNNITGQPTQFPARGNTSSEIWAVVNNNTFLTEYRNLTDADITALGYIKSIALNGYLTLARATTDFYNKTEIGNTFATIASLSNYLTLSRATTDFYNKTQIDAMPRGNTTNEIFTAVNNGTFLTSYRNITSADIGNMGYVLLSRIDSDVYNKTQIDAHKFGNTTSEIWAVVNNGTFLLEYRNLTDQDILNLGFIKSARGNSSEEIWYVVNNGTYFSNENSAYLSRSASMISFDEVLLNNTIMALAGANASAITSIITTGYYLTGGGSTGAVSIGFDETKLNATIIALASQTTGRGNTSEEIWAVVNNNTFLTEYRNLTDNDISVLGYIKSAALAPYLTMARAVTDYYNKTEIDSTLNTYLTLNRATTDYYNKTQIDSRRFGNTTTEIWNVINNGSFLTEYRNRTDAEIRALVPYNTTSQIFNVVNNGTFLTEYRNLTDADITNLGYIKNAALNGYLTLARAVTDYYNKTEITNTLASYLTLSRATTDYYNKTQMDSRRYGNTTSEIWNVVNNNTFLTEYRNITTNDIGNMGYVLLSRLNSDYYNKTNIDARRYGNTTQEIWSVVNNGTFLTEYRNLTTTDIGNMGYVLLSRLNSDYYNKTQMDARTYGNTTSEIWAVVNNGTFAITTSLNAYLTLSRATTDFYNKTEIDAMPRGNTSAEILAVTNGVYYQLVNTIHWNNISNTPAQFPARGNTSSEIWAVVNNGTFLTEYRNLTDSDITNLGYIKSAALNTYLTLARATTDFYNKTEIGNTYATITSLGNYLSLSRATTDYYNKTETNSQINAHTFGNTSAEILAVTRDVHYNRTETINGKGNTSSEIWTVVNNGTFLTEYRNRTDAEIRALVPYNSTNELFRAVNNGTFLTEYRNLTDSDITNLGYIKSAALSPYLSLARAVTDFYNKTEIVALGYITSYRNLTDNDIANMGYMKLSRADSDYYNKTQLDARKYGNTSAEILAVTRDIHYNRTETINGKGNTSQEIWAVVNNNTFLTEYRNLTDSDITNLGYAKTTALNAYLTLARYATDIYNKTEITNLFNSHVYGNTTSEIWNVANNNTFLKADGSQALTANWASSSYNITAQWILANIKWTNVQNTPSQFPARGNTTAEMVAAVPYNTTSQLWAIANNGTFLTEYRNRTDVEIRALVPYNSTNEIFRAVNNGTFLTEYRNRTDVEIRALVPYNSTNQLFTAINNGSFLYENGDTLNGNFTPASDNTYSLGTTANTFKSIYSTIFYQAGSALDTIYCKLTGCTMTGVLTLQATTSNLTIKGTTNDAFIWNNGTHLLID